MSLSRRSILKYGLGGAVALMVGGTGLAFQSTKMIEPAIPLKSLSQREFSVLHAVAEVMLPKQGRFPAASELQVAEQVDELLSGMHPGIVAELRQALLLVENALASAVFDQHFRPFTQQPLEVQHEILESWRQSRLALRRTVFQALNGICAGVYYASPVIFSAVGYGGPPQVILQLREALEQQDGSQP